MSVSILDAWKLFTIVARMQYVYVYYESIWERKDHPSASHQKWIICFPFNSKYTTTWVNHCVAVQIIETYHNGRG